MIVGKKRIDSLVLAKVCMNSDTLEKYCLSLIPIYARHLPHILDNQKYIVAIAIRDQLNLPFKLKQDISERLIKDVTIKGYLHSLTEIEDLILSCDMDKLLRSLFKEELDSVS